MPASHQAGVKPLVLDNPSEFTPAASRMLFASIVTQLLGGTMAIGLFPLQMLPISSGLDWSRTTIGSMAGVTALMAALGLPVWGALVDRYGPRRVVLIATAMTTLAFWALAIQSGSIIQGFVSFAVMGFVSSVSVAQVKAQSICFVRNRGLVLSALGMTIGLCFGLTPLAGKPILDAYGWRAVYAVFGSLPLVISMPLLLAWYQLPSVKPGPLTKPTADTTLGSAVRSRNFWLIVLLAASSGFVFAGLQAHFVAFLQDRGFTSQSAVFWLSTGTFGALLCQLFTGWLLDRLRSPRAAIPFVGVALLGMLALQFSSAPASTVIGTIALQSGVGGELSPISAKLDVEVHAAIGLWHRRGKRLAKRAPRKLRGQA